MTRAGILGIGTYLPECVVTNADLERTLDTSDEWITTRTGIKKRHFAGDREGTKDMAAKAARQALENAVITADQIDLIVVATCTADRIFPSVACAIQEEIGAIGVPALDLNAVCSGFVYGVTVAQQFIETGTYQYVLVVGVDKFSKLLDWNDRSTFVLFGDGAGAVVMGPVSDNKGILGFELGADGTGGKHLYADKFIKMNGREVFKFATTIMKDSILRTLKKCNVTLNDVDYIVTHQANIRIIEFGAEKLGLPLEKFAKTVHLHGNTSSASIPLALEHDVNKGKIEDGDLIVLTGFGAGLTWATAVLRWGK